MAHLSYRNINTLSAVVGLTALVGLANAQVTKVSFQSQPTLGMNNLQVGNRSPLAPSAFEKLPIGSIRPEGWVRRQLELETEGFTGRLTEISPWLNKKNNAWLSPTGEGDHGWEEVPYWLKGFGDLGYVLGNDRIKKEASVWINGVIASQREDGYFGPRSNLTANNGKPDVWPNMVMLAALQTYYEYTRDKRVLNLMLKYFRWELTIPDQDFLLSYWEPQRVGDNMDTVLWLYNRTGEQWLFDLVEKLHRCGAKWSKGVPDWHGVNMSQGFREPAEYYTLKKDPALIQATESDYQTIRRLYGQVPGGLYGADENARPGFGDPRQATETCTMVEMMWSDEMLLRITGSPVWAERCEDVAFNSLPASMTPDLKSLHYLTSPNMVLVDKASKSPGLQNGGPMLLFNAYDHRCCQHNASHGWPYYAEHLWLGSANNGLAALLYAPSKVTAKVGTGTSVTIEEKTTYPFDEKIDFSFSMAKATNFPLTLRWPSWCDRPVLNLNGKSLAVNGKPGGYLVISRRWSNRDHLALTLPMKIATQTWIGNKGAVSVNRGPLTYSLKIGEKYVRVGGTNAFPSLEIHPASAWNYGLVTEGQKFSVKQKPFPKDNQPFTPQSAPVSLTARARKIENWKMDRLGLVGLLQNMPAKTSSPVETVELVPMGAARLRIASFPTVSTRAKAHEWVAPQIGRSAIPAVASHVFGGDTVDALSDGLLPANSNDLSIPRFTWWDRKGSTEWVEYHFPSPKTLSQAKVYWFDDRTTGGGCRVPSTWKLQIRQGTEWVDVTPRSEYGTKLNQFNMVRFDPVTTKEMRLTVELQPNFSSGILEWEVK